MPSMTQFSGFVPTSASYLKCPFKLIVIAFLNYHGALDFIFNASVSVSIILAVRIILCAFHIKYISQCPMQ